MNDRPAASDALVLSAYEAAAQRRPWTALYESANSASPAALGTALELFHAADRDAPAVWYFDSVLDYAAVDRLSGSLAASWAAGGVSRGDRVAIILQNAPQFIVAVVAAWKLAAIPVTLNPMYRERELKLLFSDCA